MISPVSACGLRCIVFCDQLEGMLCTVDYPIEPVFGGLSRRKRA